MTTIAYKDGLMACDSAYSDSDTLLTRRSKITRLKSGGLLGSSGEDDDRAVVELFDKVKTPSGFPSRKQLIDLQVDYGGILVLPSGRIFSVGVDEPDKDQTHWSGGIFEVAEDYYAVGGGREHALTAMECGKSAKDAVHMAIRRSMTSRPPVHVVPLIKPKATKK